MTEYPAYKQLIMGRVDVLLRFLQLIGKDTPKELDSYLESVHDDTEQRPIVDQIVDMILLTDPSLYDQYAQARRELGSRNPYSSPEDSKEVAGYERTLGHFLSKWIALEGILRTQSNEKMVPLDFLVTKAGLPVELIQRIAQVRRLRNQAVHGIRTPEPTELVEAAKILEQAIQELQHINQISHPAKSKKKRRTVSKQETT